MTKKVLEFELDPILQLANKIGNKSQIFECIPADSRKRLKQKDGIISQKGDYQIIKRKGHYYGRIYDKK